MVVNYAIKHSYIHFIYIRIYILVYTFGIYIGRYIPNPEFDPALVKNASKACEGLCKWVRALDVYDRVIKIVAPKKIKLAEAQAELAVQMEKLNDKRKILQDVRCDIFLSFSPCICAFVNLTTEIIRFDLLI